MDRIPSALESKIISAAEAAAMVKPNMVLGFSGFGQVGDPHVIPAEIA